MEARYAVIFISKLKPQSEGYEDMAELMLKEVEEQAGFCGVESARSEVGITVCFWDSLENIQKWRDQESHKDAQNKGLKKWYSSYTIYICELLKSNEWHYE